MSIGGGFEILKSEQFRLRVGQVWGVGSQKMVFIVYVVHYDGKKWFPNFFSSQVKISDLGAGIRFAYYFTFFQYSEKLIFELVSVLPKGIYRQYFCSNWLTTGILTNSEHIGHLEKLTMCGRPFENAIFLKITKKASSLLAFPWP